MYFLGGRFFPRLAGQDTIYRPHPHVFDDAPDLGENAPAVRGREGGEGGAGQESAIPPDGLPDSGEVGGPGGVFLIPGGRREGGGGIFTDT